MTVNYDPRADTLTVRLSNEAIVESAGGKPGAILDFDVRGRLVGLDVLDASRQNRNPAQVELSIAV